MSGRRHQDSVKAEEGEIDTQPLANETRRLRTFASAITTLADHNATQHATIIALQARITELEEENARLKQHQASDSLRGMHTQA